MRCRRSQAAAAVSSKHTCLQIATLQNTSKHPPSLANMSLGCFRNMHHMSRAHACTSLALNIERMYVPHHQMHSSLDEPSLGICIPCTTHAALQTSLGPSLMQPHGKDNNVNQVSHAAAHCLVWQRRGLTPIPKPDPNPGLVIGAAAKVAQHFQPALHRKAMMIQSHTSTNRHCVREAQAIPAAAAAGPVVAQPARRWHGVLDSSLHCTLPQHPPHKQRTINTLDRYQPTDRVTNVVHTSTANAAEQTPLHNMTHKQASAANLPGFGRKTASASQATHQANDTHPP